MCFGKKLTREQLQALMARLTDADGMEEKDERGERDKELQELGHQRSKLVKHMENELTEKLGGKTAQTGRGREGKQTGRSKIFRVVWVYKMRTLEITSRKRIVVVEISTPKSKMKRMLVLAQSTDHHTIQNTEQGAGTEETPRKMLRVSVVDQEEIASPSPRHLESVSW